MSINEVIYMEAAGLEEMENGLKNQRVVKIVRNG